MTWTSGRVEDVEVGRSYDFETSGAFTGRKAPMWRAKVLAKLPANNVLVELSDGQRWHVYMPLVNVTKA